MPCELLGKKKMKMSFGNLVHMEHDKCKIEIRKYFDRC